MKRESKNDNLDNYRNKRLEKNEALIKKAISYIQSLSGEVTFSTVSKLSYELADIKNKEKGLTVAGITKNKLYRALVEKGQSSPLAIEKTNKKAKYSVGDLNLSLHRLRVENEKLKQDNKILTLKLKEVPDTVQLVEPVRDEIIEKNNHLQDISKSIVHRLCELEFAYIDANTRTLVLAHSGEVVIHREALEIFYKKELDGIKN